MHYGLQPSDTKGTTVKRLLDAVNRDNLDVSAQIRKVECEWSKSEEVAAEKSLLVQEPKKKKKTSAKRKNDDTQNAAAGGGGGGSTTFTNGINVSVNINSGTQTTSGATIGSVTDAQGAENNNSDNKRDKTTSSKSSGGSYFYYNPETVKS